MINQSSPKQGAEALFVDLDETLFEGTVVRMSDAEMAEAPLIEQTVRLIEQTRANGGKVIMLTRNNEDAITRFFNAKPETRHWFETSVACDGIDKSSPLQTYLSRNRIDAGKALFVDDTSGERQEVEREIEGITTADPLELS